MPCAACPGDKRAAASPHFFTIGSPRSPRLNARGYACARVRRGLRSREARRAIDWEGEEGRRSIDQPMLEKGAVGQTFVGLGWVGFYAASNASIRSNSLANSKRSWFASSRRNAEREARKHRQARRRSSRIEFLNSGHRTATALVVWPHALWATASLAYCHHGSDFARCLCPRC